MEANFSWVEYVKANSVRDEVDRGVCWSFLTCEDFTLGRDEFDIYFILICGL